MQVDDTVGVSWLVRTMTELWVHAPPDHLACHILLEYGPEQCHAEDQYCQLQAILPGTCNSGMSTQNMSVSFHRDVALRHSQLARELADKPS